MTEAAFCHASSIFADDEGSLDLANMRQAMIEYSKAFPHPIVLLRKESDNVSLASPDPRSSSSPALWPRLWDLGVIFVLTAGLDVLILVPSGILEPLRFVLALGVGLFFPGYVTTAVMFSESARLSPIERTGLSLGLSVVWVPLVALLLGLAHIRLNAPHVALSLTLVTGLGAAAAAWRRRVTSEGPAPVYPQGRDALWLGGLATALGLLTWAIVAPNLHREHLAFAVLGSSGHLEGYPYEVAFGHADRLTLQVQNPTAQARVVRIQMNGNGATARRWDLHLSPHHTWSQKVALPSNPPARSETVRFNLYQTGKRTPIRSLNVKYRIVP